MEKLFIHNFISILIISLVFETFSVSALSTSRIMETESLILRDEQVRLDPTGPEMREPRVVPEDSSRDLRLNADLPKEIKAHLQKQTEERLYVPPTAEQIAQTQALAEVFDCDTITDVPKVECEALVELYINTNGAGWNNNEYWLTGSEVGEWYGVQVDTGHVSELTLYSNQLTGTIPPELGNLTDLTYLDLYDNQLTGSIPPELANLTLLIKLYLDENHLTGSIPPALGSMTKLQSLFLGYNMLTGSIPPELGNLTNLLYLFSQESNLTGSIPPELGDLTELRSLYLGYNQLTGSIPSSLGNLTNLSYLNLGVNLLKGNIPLSYADLTSMEYFNFQDTQLCEPLDSAFQDWKASVPEWSGTDILCISNSYLPFIIR